MNREKTTMKKIALSFALVEPDAGDAVRQARVDHRHLRRGENGGGVRRRLHHERRSRDDRTRSAARLEGRSRPVQRRVARRPRRRRRARRRTPTSAFTKSAASPRRRARRMFVDARATPAQRKALVAMVKSLSGNRHRQRRPGDGRADPVRRQRPRHPRLDRRAEAGRWKSISTTTRAAATSSGSGR